MSSFFAAGRMPFFSISRSSKLYFTWWEASDRTSSWSVLCALIIYPAVKLLTPTGRIFPCSASLTMAFISVSTGDNPKDL